jgi:hypothetical protein
MGFIFVAIFALLAAFDRPIYRGRSNPKTPAADSAGTQGA